MLLLVSCDCITHEGAYRGRAEVWELLLTAKAKASRWKGHHKKPKSHNDHFQTWTLVDVSTMRSGLSLEFAYGMWKTRQEFIQSETAEKSMQRSGEVNVRCGDHIFLFTAPGQRHRFLSPPMFVSVINTPTSSHWILWRISCCILTHISLIRINHSLVYVWKQLRTQF